MVTTGLVARRLLAEPPATLVRTIGQGELLPALSRQRLLLLAVETHLVLAPEVAVVAELVAGGLPADLVVFVLVPVVLHLAEVVGGPESVAVVLEVVALEGARAGAGEASKDVRVGGGDVEGCLEEEEESEGQVVEEHHFYGRCDAWIKYK